MRTHYDAQDLGRMTASLASAIAAECAPGKAITVVGIRTRGHLLADRIAARLIDLNCVVGRGVLDITLYRDDLSEIGPRPVVRPTRMDGDIDGKPLFLIDDVLFTGRTVRAALNALADFGRPSAIRLAVLVDRGGRELPIQADFTGVTQNDVPMSHRVKVKLVESDGIDEIVIEPRTAR
jgi:pyrimidine operon attenuation protein/uracil phosphoribosyltransferase